MCLIGHCKGCAAECIGCIVAAFRGIMSWFDFSHRDEDFEQYFLEAMFSNVGRVNKVQGEKFSLKKET